MREKKNIELHFLLKMDKRANLEILLVNYAIHSILSDKEIFLVFNEELKSIKNVSNLSDVIQNVREINKKYDFDKFKNVKSLIRVNVIFGSFQINRNLFFIYQDIDGRGEIMILEMLLWGAAK